MSNYEQLSRELTERIAEDKAKGTLPNFRARSADAVRRDADLDREAVWRSAYVRDVDKVLHSPFYNRYTDKTQVFSFYKNDDISRRALHVQLVSRIARSIGKVLNLNLDLIEAIALGHDIGHTPFGHAGERYLSEMYHAETGRFFNHNVHSVRVLDGIFRHNLTLDTLNGIITHNGEFEMHEYFPAPMRSFAEFDRMVESCYVDQANIISIVPSTLEGCLVRVCDIIAYLGRDRQDAERAQIVEKSEDVGRASIGGSNPEIINNLMVNIIEHSYGKPYIMMDEEHFMGLSQTKRENYKMIYHSPAICMELDGTVKPVIQKLYDRLLTDLKAGNTSSPIFRHHIDFIKENHYASPIPYMETEKNQIVVDYLASMTDDYCIDLFQFLFPSSNVTFPYKGYFYDYE